MVRQQPDSFWAKGTTPRGIKRIGDDILTKKCERTDVTKHVRELCRRMVRRLRSLRAAGLAAPQVGELLRVAVIELRENTLFPNRQASPLYVMVNPVITRRSRHKVLDWEGCLSIPGYVAKVSRHSEVEVRFDDLDGNTHKEAFKGTLARAMQHEVDHLDGILYTKHINPVRDLLQVAEYLELLCEKK